MVGVKKKFGAEIYRLRLNKKYGLRECAKKVRISATYLSRIEKGVDPPPSGDKISKLAEVLEVDNDELFRLANKSNPDYIAKLTLKSNLPTLIAEISASSDDQALVDDLIKVARQKNKKKTK